MLRGYKKVLVRAKESQSEQGDDFALNELSEIRRNAETRFFKRLSSLSLVINSGGIYCAQLL